MAAAPRPKNAPQRQHPPRRKAFFGYDPTKLQNPDPSKRYKFVDPSAKMDGVDANLARGWEIVLRSKDGPELQRGAEGKSTEPVTLEGLILMQIDRAEHDRIEREGVYGQGGQELLDEIEEQIINPGGVENVRGGRIATVVNETRPTESFDSAI